MCDIFASPPAVGHVHNDLSSDAAEPPGDRPIVEKAPANFHGGRSYGMTRWSSTGGEGRRDMRMLLRDIVLFSCAAAFVTGIVIAVASLLS
jgi:hypothetical protein